MFEIEGFILAGGASSRMGTDKAHLRLGEQTLVERVARALEVVTGKIFVVSSKPDAHVWGLPVVPDTYVGRGALGGLHAAFLNASAPWAAVVSCDLPFVTGSLFRELALYRREDVDAVAPVQEDGFIQPLCTLYAPAKCLKAAEELLESGDLRARELLRRIHVRLVSFGEIAALPGSSRFFSNLNTPEDFRSASEEALKLGPEF